MNVSRSYLQNNTYITKVSAHISKKTADKLNSLCINEREKYEKLWGDLKTFVEYACMRDKKFYDRVKASLLLKMTDGKFETVDGYLEGAKEKHEGTVYYATDASLQSQYISMFESQGIKVALLDKVIDTQFVTMLEQYTPDTKYVRIDADVASALKGEGDVQKNEELEKLFKAASGNEELKVEFENLLDESVPALINVSEQSRRMEEMMKMYAMTGDAPDMSFPVEMSIVLNMANPLTKKIADTAATDQEKAQKLARQVFYLALMSQRPLTAVEMKAFLEDSFKILENI